MNLQSLDPKNRESIWMEVRRYYAINHAFYDMEPHTHSELEVMYAADGACAVWVRGSDDWEEHCLKEGEYIFLDGEVPHRLAVARESPCRVLNLELALIPAKLPFSFQLLCGSDPFAAFLDRPRTFFTGSDTAGTLHQQIVRLQRLLYGRGSSLECDLQLASFFLEMAGQNLRSRKTTGGFIWVKRAVSYLEENYDREITVESVSSAVGVSRAYLQRLFKEEIGQSILDWILSKRIDKAKYLLETSTLPIIDIAVGVGFNNRQHFSQLFRKLVGCPPSVYRKHRGNDRMREGFENI